MNNVRFSKDFTQQEPLSSQAVEHALAILQSGRLHRYNVTDGEKGETALLEEEFANYIGTEYCLACSSCGSAMYLALKAAGVKSHDRVLCNAYTLAPVPGAIENSGAEIELVEISEDYTIDLEDLEKKAPGARWLLLSHMRGHIVDMARVTEICERFNITLIEDCAHTMGASWDGKKSGSFGRVGCFSTQTYKHINSGEGGLLVTSDPDLIARAILYSGSYMLYGRHTARPDIEVFEAYRTQVPNYSCRMDNLRASILRPQLEMLDKQCQRWNKRYRILEQGLRAIPGITCPERRPQEYYVGSSIQFTLSGHSEETIKGFLAACLEMGIELKWFGNEQPVGFTSKYSSWQYFVDMPNLPRTNSILATMCDMRIPLTFSLADCQQLVHIIADVAKTQLH